MPRPTSQLRELAVIGAHARMDEIRKELLGIQRFLREVGGSVPARPMKGRSPAPRKRGRRKMSAAARKAVSLRMKKYWAARRSKKA